MLRKWDDENLKDLAGDLNDLSENLAKNRA